MAELLKYISGAIVGAVICLLIFQECGRSDQTENTRTDTVIVERVISDTIELTIEKPVYVDRVRRFTDIDTITDTITRYIALDSMRTYEQTHEDSLVKIDATVTTRGFLEEHSLTYELKERKISVPEPKPDNWDVFLGATGNGNDLYGGIGVRRKSILIQGGYSPFSKGLIFGVHYKIF